MKKEGPPPGGLVWNGSVRPADPDRGLGIVTGIRVGTGAPRPAGVFGDAPKIEKKPEKPALGAGLRLEAKRMDLKGEPRTIRPDGRVRLKPV